MFPELLQAWCYEHFPGEPVSVTEQMPKKKKYRKLVPDLAEH